MADPTHRHDEQRGVTMVLLGVSLVALIMVAGLVLDGGAAYGARRQVQNATDAAALAGAQALFDVKYDTATGRTSSPPRTAAGIAAAVVAKLSQNRAGSEHSCVYTTATGSTTGVACGQPVPANAAGVLVGAAINQSTAFVRVAGPTSVTARARSTAALLPLYGTAAPFIICGSSPEWPILNPLVAGEPATINVANAVASGSQPVQAAKVATCGAGDSFKGKTDDDEDQIIVNQDAEGETGNGFEDDTYDQVVGAGLTPCPVPFPENYTGTCDMMLPIADTGYGNGSGKIFLHIAAWGIFRITGNGSGNPKYYGQFVAPAGLANGGVAQSGVACTVGSQLCIVKMLS